MGAPTSRTRSVWTWAIRVAGGRGTRSWSTRRISVTIVWFGLGGDFFSENAQLVERFLLQDADTLAYEATITDPTVFTRPWTIRYGPHRRVAESDREHVENSCHEGNVDLARLKTLYDAANPER